MWLKSRQAAWLDARLRPCLVRFPAPWVVRFYSQGRSAFLKAYEAGRPPWVEVPKSLSRELWGIKFRSPILNAAGMFKSGGGYGVVSRQGAGAFLSGTTTATPRTGNQKDGFTHPFAPYPRSGAASNWLGLPNPGHAEVASRLHGLTRVEGCPLGASLGADPAPEIEARQKLEDLVSGLRAYEDAGMDFLEINESCPNTEAGGASFDDMIDRLAFVAEHFLEQRRRFLPVVVKFSNDTEPAQLPRLIDTLINLGFDGVNFGNTSVRYDAVRQGLDPAERGLFDFFTRSFGGGVSGRPLKESSLALVRFAAEHLANLALDREFHIIRTGGVENADDVRRSLDAGASLVQWYTGYFEAFAHHGHGLYAHLYDQL